MTEFVKAADKPKNAFDLSAYYANQTVEVWPENWPSWRLFSEMFGQWRMAPMGGRYAMDYGVLFMRMDRMRLTDDEWESLYLDVRVLEQAALEQLRNNED